MNGILTAIEGSGIGTTVRDIAWMFPACEALHFIGLCFLFGAMLIVDLRIVGTARFIPAKPAMAFIPVAIIGFALVLITGLGMFCADPFRYYVNLAFRWKIFLIFLAGLNALWFWFGEHSKLLSLPDGEVAKGNAKLIAMASLLIWATVLVLGRMIPYVE